MKIVYVEWEDASRQEGPLAPGDFLEKIILITVGILAKETDTHLSIAFQKQVDDEWYRCVTHIPKKYIKRKKYLK